MASKKKLPQKKHQTPLQLHVSQSDFALDVKSKLIDLTEIKLRRLFQELKVTENKLKIHDLIQKYVAGTAVVGWSGGDPVYQERDPGEMEAPSVA